MNKTCYLILLAIVMLIVSISTAYSQKTVLLICAQDLELHSLTDSSFIKIKTNLKIIRLSVVDTTLFLFGFDGSTPTDNNNYAYQRLYMWSTSLPQVIKNKTIDAEKLVLIDDSTYKKVLLSFENLGNTSSVRRDNKTLKYYINNKLNSINIENILKIYYKKYRLIKPLIFIREISNNYQNKCVFNLEIFAKNNHKQESHNLYTFLVVYDLQQQKIMRNIPIRPRVINSIKIIE